MSGSRFAVALMLVVGSGLAAEFPGPAPERPKASEKDSLLTLENNLLAVSWRIKDGRLVRNAIQNKLSGQMLPETDAVLFRLRLGEGRGETRGVSSAEMEVVRAPAVEPVKGDAKSVRVGDRFDGQAITETLRDAKSGMVVEWRTEMREGANYVRTILKISGGAAATELQWLELTAMRAKQPTKAGRVTGVPVVVGQTFFATEMPFGESATGPDDFICVLNCKLPLGQGAVHSFPTVTGVVPEGQMRRAFLYYLERERARPYKPFLHYNPWFDLGYNINEKDMLARIASFTEEMTTKRGVRMASYVLDDGWDNCREGFWTIDQKKFPSGFEPLAAELDRVGSHLGIWISPMAGYCFSEERIAEARKLGLVSGNSLDLSEAKYYAWFRDYCASFVTRNRVNYFKWDKAGGGVSPHFMALLRCAEELRRINPDLFFNVTVGTWPSPFWLNVIDCTWRDGDDMGYSGKGDDREQWINYRDWMTYRNVVTSCPLYPLNSIMNHGIVMAREGLAHRCSKAGNNLLHEARSYFGSGTALQELYIEPKLMAPASWDALATAAKWAHQNTDVLVDTHWVGGDPNKPEVYGWAAWSPRKGILTLRNPDDKPASLSLDIGQAFELPAGEVSEFTLTSPYPDQRIQKVEVKAGTPHVFMLEPFEVLVLESSPTERK